MQVSARSTIERLYSAVNRRRMGLATTSGSGTPPGALPASGFCLSLLLLSFFIRRESFSAPTLINAVEDVSRLLARRAVQGRGNAAYSRYSDDRHVRLYAEMVNSWARTMGNVMMDAYEMYAAPFDEQILIEVRKIRDGGVRALSGSIDFEMNLEAMRNVRNGEHGKAIAANFRRQLMVQTQYVDREVSCILEERKAKPKDNPSGAKDVSPTLTFKGRQMTHDSAIHLKTASPLLRIIVVGVLVAGLALAGMGIWLVRLGSSGATKMMFFGQSFDSSNVGIASIFVGAIVIVVVLTRLMKRMNELAALPTDRL